MSSRPLSSSILLVLSVQHVIHCFYHTYSQQMLKYCIKLSLHEHTYTRTICLVALRLFNPHFHVYMSGPCHV